LLFLERLAHQLIHASSYCLPSSDGHFFEVAVLCASRCSTVLQVLKFEALRASERCNANGSAAVIQCCAAEIKPKNDEICTLEVIFGSKEG
jgi:hypothetical protein